MGELERHYEERIIHSRQNWLKASDKCKNDYKINLKEKLNNIPAFDNLENCSNVHCKDPAHIDELDRVTIETIEAMEIVEALTYWSDPPPSADVERT